MSSHLTAEDISLYDDHILVACLRNADGELVDAEIDIDLDNCVGNDEGKFVWGGFNFSGSTKHVNFLIGDEGEAPVICGELCNSDGKFSASELNLSERILNVNGELVFQA